MSKFKCHLVAIDYESTGTNISEGIHQAITCGAIITDIDTLEEIDRIYIECAVENRYKWTSGAEKCHGLSYEYMQQQQSMAEAAMQLFEFFIKNGVKSTDYLMLLGHNVDFDARCLRQWMDHIDVPVFLTHRQVDTFALGFGMLGSMDSNELFDHVGVVRTTHNALEDAEAALMAVRYCRKIGEKYQASI